MGQVVDFDISTSDRLGFPVTSCSMLVDGRLTDQGNGYGRDTGSARIGGLGELAEGTLLTPVIRELLRDGIRSSRTELVDRDGPDRVVDPRTLGLPTGSPYNENTVLTWLPATRVRTGETVYVPVDFLVSDPGEMNGEPLITPVSNGLGAGLGAERAIAHGIGEILQRHTNGLRFRALDRLSPEIDPTSLPDSVQKLADQMRAVGVSPVFKHAATEFGVCSVYVIGVDEGNDAGIRLAGCGEAAHPSAEVSLTKALLEFANLRARKSFFFGPQQAARQLGPREYWDAVDAGAEDLGEPRAREALLAWNSLNADELRRLTEPNRDRMVSYDDIVVPDVPELTGQSQLLEHLLTALDGRTPQHDVLTLTATSGAVTVAKVLVTNLDVEILSYGRIGELGVRACLDNGLDLVRVGGDATATHDARVPVTSEAEERLGGSVWYSYAAAAQIVGALYPLYREPPRHSVVVEEA